MLYTLWVAGHTYSLAADVNVIILPEVTGKIFMPWHSSVMLLNTATYMLLKGVWWALNFLFFFEMNTATDDLLFKWIIETVIFYVLLLKLSNSTYKFDGQ